MVFSDYTETFIDPKLQYLLFKYDWEYFSNRQDADIVALSNCLQCKPRMGVALRPEHDFHCVLRHRGLYDDPFEWDGLIPIAPSSDFSMPGVGIWTFGNDDIDRMQLPAVYDLAVEAQNKAGDWSLSHSDDGEGIYLLNDNGLYIWRNNCLR